jgi:HD-like signal output (HDOD) protein
MHATELADGPGAQADHTSPDDHASPERDAALARILDKLARQPDFPSLEDALSGVRRVARSDKARLQNLSEALLNDVGLANRVLRLANAAHYRSAGGGQITTLTRAIAVMGFTEIGQLAVASRLVDQIRDRRQASMLREEFLRALLAGVMAHELTNAHDEEAYIVAVFQNLGRLVTCLHCPEEAQAVRQAVPRHRWPRIDDEHLAARKQMGVSHADLGLAVAGRWGWPEPLRRTLRRDAVPLHLPMLRPERLRCLGMLANDLADLLIFGDPASWDRRCDELQARLGGATEQDARSMRAAMARARTQMERLADLLSLPLSQLPAWGGPPDVAAAEAAEASALAWVPTPAQTLSDGVHDVVQALAEGCPASRVQAMVVETLLRGLNAQRAVLCLRRGRQGDLAGCLGLGRGVPSGHEHFMVPAGDPHDLFSLLCGRGADTLISDADEPAIAARLPRWWRLHARSRSFLVLPMMQGREAVGMLYCDAPQADGLVVDAAAMKLASTLRGQALIAWRQGD